MSAAKPMSSTPTTFEPSARPRSDSFLRREREGVAPRLRSLVPTLVELRFQIDEHVDDAQHAETTHIRRVLVDTAPAIFLVGCTAWGCKGGGFEVSDGVLAALRRHETEFVVTDSCLGHTRAAACQRRLRVRGFAKYTAS